MNKYNNYDSVSQLIDTLGWNALEDRHNKLRTRAIYGAQNHSWTYGYPGNLATTSLIANSLPGVTCITGFSSCQLQYI